MEGSINGYEVPVPWMGLVGKDFRPPAVYLKAPYLATLVDSLRRVLRCRSAHEQLRPRHDDGSTSGKSSHPSICIRFCQPDTCTAAAARGCGTRSQPRMAESFFTLEDLGSCGEGLGKSLPKGPSCRAMVSTWTLRFDMVTLCSCWCQKSCMTLYRPHILKGTGIMVVDYISMCIRR